MASHLLNLLGLGTHAEKFASHPKGFIGLQVHGIGRRKGPFEVRWRKLMLREIRKSRSL